MQCIGRTKKLQRCKNAARVIVCKTHEYQPWTALLFVLTIIGLLAGLYQDLLKPVLSIVGLSNEVSKRERLDRPYVFFKQALLGQNLKAGETPVIQFILSNSGNLEAVCTFGNINYYFDLHSDNNELPIKETASQRIEIAPLQEYGGEFRISGFSVTEAKQSAIEKGLATLYFFTDGSYEDDRRLKYEIDVCWVYDKDMSGYLRLCSDEEKKRWFNSKQF